MIHTIQRILLPTDFSEASANAKDYACALAGLLNADLHVLHVLPDCPPQSSLSGASSEIPRLEIERSAQQQLSALMADSRINLEKVYRQIRFGNPVDQILNYAKDHHISLIVLGTHGRTGLSHALIGSVTENVVQLATCPVLTVHPEATAPCAVATESSQRQQLTTA